jgi:Transposase domain (DUF772)
MAPTRRTRTDRSHRVENRKRAAHVVGRDPPRDVSGDWPAELEAVDRLLDDPAFFDPLRAHFHATLGRPSVPIETYLRLMFLKYRHRLGFEPLCREVADSISWQRFVRIPLGTVVPHSTTLMKITTRCGTSAVEGLNEALLSKAVNRPGFDGGSGYWIPTPVGVARWAA